MASVRLTTVRSANPIRTAPAFTAAAKIAQIDQQIVVARSKVTLLAEKQLSLYVASSEASVAPSARLFGAPHTEWKASFDASRQALDAASQKLAARPDDASALAQLGTAKGGFVTAISALGSELLAGVQAHGAMRRAAQQASPSAQATAVSAEQAVATGLRAKRALFLEARKDLRSFVETELMYDSQVPEFRARYTQLVPLERAMNARPADIDAYNQGRDVNGMGVLLASIGALRQPNEALILSRLTSLLTAVPQLQGGFP